MRQIFLFSLLFLGVLSCRKDIGIPPEKICEDKVTAVTELYFEQDVNLLVFNKMISDSVLHSTSNYELNPLLKNKVLAKLSAIHYHAANNPGTPIYDVIFNYKVHKWKGYIPHTIVLNFNNEPDLNTFLARIESEEDITTSFIKENMVSHTYINSFYSSLYLKSTEALDLMSMKFDLESTYPEINYTWLSWLGIDGNNITHESDGPNDYFTFDYGWGDCPSGCFGHHFWKIKVDANCNVELIEEWGNPLPE